MADITDYSDVTPERRASWMTRISPSVMQTKPFRRASTLIRAGTGLSDLSRTRISGNFDCLSVDELERQHVLVSLIVGEEIVKGSLERACSWYLRFLRSVFNSHWHLLVRALDGLDTATSCPRPGDLVIVYDFVIQVAKFIRNKQNLALVDIVDELDSNRTLKQQLDQERAVSNQVAFAAVGWLTMFFDPVSNPRVDRLEVTQISTTSFGVHDKISTRKILSFQQGFDYIDRPIHSMLNRFGDLIPGSKMFMCAEPDLLGCPSRDVIMVQSVCFNTLHGLAELNIEWVTALSLHLELDSGKKSIKLFQYPSFCRMQAAQRRKNVLSRILNDHAASSCEDVSVPDFATADYFEEILLSYRLIFGQDPRSWKAFSRMISTKEDDPEQAMTSMAYDPLLPELCAKSYGSEEARLVYDDIGANEPIDCYSPHTEFPFFGRRLLEIQHFVQRLQPQNVRSLLNDRRDVASWYNLWNNQILVVFATMTIFLMVVSLIFQVWQVFLALHPPA